MASCKVSHGGKISLAFIYCDQLMTSNLFMVWGLVGDDCKNESAEKCDAEAGGQHDVARGKGGFEFGFGFVGHGLGLGG